MYDRLGVVCLLGLFRLSSELKSFVVGCLGEPKQARLLHIRFTLQECIFRHG
jgi:hypothetical protein